MAITAREQKKNGEYGLARQYIQFNDIIIEATYERKK